MIFDTTFGGGVCVLPENNQEHIILIQLAKDYPIVCRHSEISNDAIIIHKEGLYKIISSLIKREIITMPHLIKECTIGVL